MRNLLFCLLLTSSVSLLAQERIFLYPASEKVTIDGFEKDKEAPYIDYYRANPDSANRAAILICPGGSYTNLAMDHEGVQVAKFYNSYGFDAFVLKYRLNISDQSGHRFPDQYRDVTTAMRLIKSRAKGWNLDPERIGVLGFSAGGHLASMATTMHLRANKKSKIELERWSSRPAFSLLIYPVITLSGAYAHNNSRDMLLGKNPDNDLVDSLSTYNRVDDHTPPTFIIFSNDDQVVPPENGILFYQALRRHNIPASLHIYDRGGHGYGLGSNDKVLSTWPLLSVKWLEKMSFRIRKK
jgi:acetyl esterase/lipase